MRFSHHRLLKVFMSATVLALAAGSTAAAAAPAAHPSKKKATPCTVNQTWKYTANIPVKVWTVKTNGTNIRTGPGTDCKIVRVATGGTKLSGTGKHAVIIAKSTSKWTQVKEGTVIEWIADTQIK